jgi:hypothetical protein
MKAEANIRPVYRRAATADRREWRSAIEVVTTARRLIFSTAEFF